MIPAWLNDPEKRERAGICCLCPSCLAADPSRRVVLLHRRSQIIADLRAVRGDR